MILSPQQQSIYRGISDLRRGIPILFHSGFGDIFMVHSAEQISDDRLAALILESSSMPSLLLTSHRARGLGLSPKPDKIGCSILLSPDVTASDIFELIGERPASKNLKDSLTVLSERKDSLADMVLRLLRFARLLPAAIIAPLGDSSSASIARWVSSHHYTLVHSGAVADFEVTMAEGLRLAARAKLPLRDCEDSEIVIFQPQDGGTEHFALLIGDVKGSVEPLVRIHSQCITGDILGSLKCDCGDQLRLSIRQMAASGGGLLIYLAQEGRDIGLVNKLRAYGLQDAGLDTVDANHALGFDIDHRYYLPAAVMLRHLGYDKIRLLTNNPDKVQQIEDCGLRVIERIDLAPPSNPHNEHYLAVKKSRTGHLLD